MCELQIGSKHGKKKKDRKGQNVTNYENYEYNMLHKVA